MTTDTPETQNLAAARRYLAALERGAVGDELAAFFTADAVQREYPNRLTPNGAERDVPALLAGAVRGQQVVAAQRYEVVNAFASGAQVALEVLWRATLKIALGALPAGGEMRARFAVLLEYRDGLICRQHNYDCFEPW